MRPHYSISVPPLIEPLTYAQAADHLRVDSDDDIAYIEGLISVAREYVEDVTGRVSSLSQWLCVAASWADLAEPMDVDIIRLRRTPLVSVQSVKYYAPDEDTLTTMSVDDYRVITSTEPGILQITGNMPDVDDRPDAIQIAFTAGPASPAASPAILRHGIKMVVGHLYENRLPVAFSSCQEIPYTIQTILENQRVGGRFA